MFRRTMHSAIVGDPSNAMKPPVPAENSNAQPS